MWLNYTSAGNESQFPGVHLDLLQAVHLNFQVFRHDTSAGNASYFQTNTAGLT